MSLLRGHTHRFISKMLEGLLRYGILLVFIKCLGTNWDCCKQAWEVGSSYFPLRPLSSVCSVTTRIHLSSSPGRDLSSLPWLQIQQLLCSPTSEYSSKIMGLKNTPQRGFMLVTAGYANYTCILKEGFSSPKTK